MAHPAAPSTPPAHAHPAEHHGSYWPILLTVATTVFLMGLLRPIREWTDGVPVIAAIGFVGLCWTVYGWIREDVHELRGKPFNTEGKSPYFWGTIVLILSEVVIFGILFFFYFWSRSHTADFLPDGFLHLDLTPIYVNTAILLSSGVTVHMALHALQKDEMRKYQAWLGATIVLGLAFLAGQVIEYVELVHEGITPQSSVFGTAFYSLTGVHGLHVLAGVVVLTILFGLSFTGFIRKERHSAVEGAFLYWHFVDAIWVLVFLFVYLRVI